MKKSSPWSGVLLAVLVLSVLVNIALCYQYMKLVGIARRGAVFTRTLQEKVERANQDRAVLQAIAVESLKYARTNREMFQVVQPFFPTFHQLGINLNSNTPAAGTQP
ncbi:MAG: hypothetical protein KDM81_13490 [Verrucomicrobiae bacterium]|nr:hypothetical protein [Verrucomicrobiae bacterium]MCP5520320.1 hypothetical protein [Verrucomicrobiales bacterium]